MMRPSLTWCREIARTNILIILYSDILFCVNIATKINNILVAMQAKSALV